MALIPERGIYHDCTRLASRSILHLVFAEGWDCSGTWCALHSGVYCCGVPRSRVVHLVYLAPLRFSTSRVRLSRPLSLTSDAGQHCHRSLSRSDRIRRRPLGSRIMMTTLSNNPQRISMRCCEPAWLSRPLLPARRLRPPTTQRSHQPGRSLSLGSLGDFHALP